MGFGPFDMTGGAFLALYGALLLLAIIASIAIPGWRRPEGRAGREADVDQLAYLAGGGTRLADAVIARLLAAGALAMENGGKFHIAAAAQGNTAAERDVLELSSPASIAELEQAATRTIGTTEEALARQGLLISRTDVWRMRWLQTAPYLLLLVFGAIKWNVGVTRGRPVGYLTALLLITGGLALLRWFVIDRRTRSGIAVLEAARDRADRLRRAPVAAETSLAVALFGTVVLNGSEWSDYHRLRASSSSDGGGSSSNDSGGGDSGGSGGDGGGGGCGGCSS